MILKADEIANRLKSRKLVIAPSPCKKLEDLCSSGNASIDLRLGTWFLTLRHARLSHLELQIRSKSLVDVQHEKVTRNQQLTKLQYVRFGDEYFLHPGKFVLGITLEWLRLPANLAAYVIGKSSLGRKGLIIATATGVHPGYTGCITLELSNVGEIPVALTPGMQICQIFFHSTNESNTISTSRYDMKRIPVLGSGKIDPIVDSLSKAF